MHSKHTPVPNIMPPLTLPPSPKQQKRTLLWSFLFAEEHPSGSLAFYRKRLQRKYTWGATYTSKHPAASFPFSGAWFMCVFSRFVSAPNHSVLCGSRVFSSVFWEPQSGDTLLSTRDELESSPSISASSVTHWTSLTPVIKLGKDGGLCTPQEDWSRSCSQTVLLIAHRERK